MQWLRWYQGTSEDGKFRVTARNAGVTVSNAVSVWVMLLEDASHADHRGIAVRDNCFIAAILDLTVDQVADILDAMHTLGMIEICDEGWRITRWKERQFETDLTDATNAERQRRYRERKRAEAHNVNGTDAKRERNGSVTATKRPDTDTESDTESNPPKPPKGGVGRLSKADLVEFESWYAGYPHKVQRGSAEKAWPKARAKASLEDIKAGTARYIAAKPADHNWRNPATFLNGEGWLDVPAGSVAESTGAPRAPRPVIALRWHSGDLDGLRMRLRSANSSGFKVWLDGLIPTEPGVTTGPEPPEGVMAELSRWAGRYDVSFERVREAA